MNIKEFVSLEYAVRIANYFSPHPDRCSWGPRVIEDHEFILQVRGSGKYTSEDTSLTILEKELLLIPPGPRHTYACAAEGNPAISCLHFSAPGIPDGRPVRFDVRDDFVIHDLFRRCADEFVRQEKYYDRVMDRMLGEIWIRLYRSRLQAPERYPVQVRKARDYIRSRSNQPLTRSMIARTAGVTPEYLNYLFRRYCDDTPLQYLTRIRMNRAKALLLSARNVSQTAYAVGYEDPLYFSRVFKKNTGVSPTEYTGA